MQPQLGQSSRQLPRRLRRCLLWVFIAIVHDLPHKSRSWLQPLRLARPTSHKHSDHSGSPSWSCHHSHRRLPGQTGRSRDRAAGYSDTVTRRAGSPASDSLPGQGGFRLILGVATASTGVLTGLGLLVIACGKAAGLAAPFALKRGVNSLGSMDTAGLTWIIGFGMLKATSQALNNGKNVVLSWISRPLGRRLAVKLYSHVLRMELQFHTMRKTGDLLRRLERSARAVDTLLRAILFTFIPVCVELAVVSRILARQGFEVAAAVLTAFALYWVFTAFISLGWVTRARRRMNVADNLQSARATDALLNIEQVKLVSAEPREQSGFNSAQLEFQLASQSSDVAAGFLSGGQQAITTTGLTFALWSVGRRVLHGAASVGDIFMVHNLIMQLWSPLQFLGFYVREARQAFVDLEDAKNLLARESEVPVPDNPMALPALQPSTPVVEFCHVSFSYGDVSILQDLSFELRAGSYVALIGASGCGKTTVGRLVPRLLDVQGGHVLFNGVDVRQASLSDLRNRIAVVSQDVVVFNDTLRYNLLYANPDASEERLQAAIKQSQLQGTVTSLPEGLDTLVGERGLRLSGGERQRLALARALMRTPDLLILDEATSALDAESEQGALRELLGATGRTQQAVLAITHRLASACCADEILVLQDGKLAERGSHKELVARGGVYASMLAAQNESGIVSA